MYSNRASLLFSTDCTVAGFKVCFLTDHTAKVLDIKREQLVQFTNNAAITYSCERLRQKSKIAAQKALQSCCAVPAIDDSQFERLPFCVSVTGG